MMYYEEKANLLLVAQFVSWTANPLRKKAASLLTNFRC
jgi:hypothetical protein